MTRMELLAYLSANLFRIYTLFRFTENFFSERKTTVKWIIVSFLMIDLQYKCNTKKE